MARRVGGQTGMWQVGRWVGVYCEKVCRWVGRQVGR